MSTDEERVRRIRWMRQIQGFRTGDFRIGLDIKIPAFSEGSDYVQIDDTYLFDHDTTMAILAGFSHNRRV